MKLFPRLLLYGLGGAGLFLIGRELLHAALPPPRSRPLTLPSTKQGFVQAMLNALSAVFPSSSIDAKLLIVAQAAYESGYGKTSQAKQANNVFNVAAGTLERPAPVSVWSGPVMIGGDEEHARDGRVTKIRQRWRVYPSLEAAIGDWWKLMGLNRYRPAQEQILAGDVAFIRTIGPPPEGCPSTRGCYYTLPTEKYLPRYLGVLKEVRALAPASLPGGPPSVA